MYFFKKVKKYFLDSFCRSNIYADLFEFNTFKCLDIFFSFKR